MSRSPVTIVIPAWNSWETTRTCLDALRPTLGVRDQVIVVDQGSIDATSTSLRLYPWVEVISRGTNAGFAAAVNESAAQARHDILVLLHNDTVVTNRWLEPLVSALDSRQAAAAGPVSDWAAGAQAVLAPPSASLADTRRWARDWCAARKDAVVDVAELDGFCLAIRRPLLLEIGGLDEGYGLGSWEVRDLCLKLGASGHRMVVAEDSFVHHEGRVSFIANGVDWLTEREAHRSRFEAAHGRVTLPPLVSACLITKDEEDSLPSCLSSLEGVADEVVIYDTGSTDGTVELARRLGATVVEGTWNDDFSRARNAALAHCTGEWIAWLDADETLQTGDDPKTLIDVLERTRTDIDAWSVRIRNQTGAGTGSEFVHHATRFFRRSRCEWAGRLHEQITTRNLHGPIRQAELEAAWIDHTGYLDRVMAEKGKAERNLRVAQAEVDHADGWDQGFSSTSLGRSLVLAGRYDEGLEYLVRSLDETDNPITRRLAVRAAIDATVGLERWREALGWCERLRREGADPRTADIMEAPVRLGLGEYQEALALLERVTPGRTDADGFGASLGAHAAQTAQALAGLDRYGEAADRLLAAFSEEGVLDAHLGALADYMIRGGRPLSALAAAIPADRNTLFLAQVLQLNAGVADLVLEACLGSTVDQKAVLATASRLAVRLPVDRALMWSARLRAAGHAFACPLVSIAGSDGPPVLRARAAATAVRAFGDDRGRNLFAAAFAAAAGEEQGAIVAEAGQLCPELLGAVGAR